MDSRQCMIVDLDKRGKKQMFMTERVQSINKNKNGLWSVKFLSSSHPFCYNSARLLYLTNPEIIDIGEKGLYINNKRINNVAELLRFSEGKYSFYRITYSNGYYENIDGRNVYLTRTPIDKNGGSIWDYLRKLAAETGLTTDENINILSKQYDLVDLKRDNVPLAQYLGNQTKLITNDKPKNILYSFGCNASQKSAVEKALTHQLSIIQGPPGTGKTQTILNIIANLLMSNKTVLVVSNNNSAVDNIYEKLYKEDLGFIVAKLGSVINKNSFIENQPGYPDMNSWILKNHTEVQKQASDAIENISQAFDAQIRKAQLKSEIDALHKERKYNDMLRDDVLQDEWLKKTKSSELFKFLNQYQRKIENDEKPDLWFKLKWSLIFGFKTFSLLKHLNSYVIESLESAYYLSKEDEMEQELDSISFMLQSINIEQNIQDMCSSSIKLVKHKIAKQYSNDERRKFSIGEIKAKSEDFLKEYPVVLSTTYSAKSCISNDMVFDYVIMDEASQVDIKTGALALSCATNAVIVGDDKQLPNVIDREEEQALNAIQSTYSVDDKYNAATHSFLQSCQEVFKDAPISLLREHYRCHPKIIEFCNQRFYNGELIAMTNDNDEDNVLQVIRTTKGNHARQHFNQREIDVICQEIIPDLKDEDNIGIITPYRSQAEKINQTLGEEFASTVHKFQGRECDTIIMTMVDNEPTSFSDDSNLLNVAISRAKHHLYLVVNGNDIPQESNLAQLIGYIQYNNFDIKESRLRSVFDILYKQYTKERIAYEKSHPKVSDYLSENLVYNVLIQAIKDLNMTNTDLLCHYPISKLIVDQDLLNSEEKTFANSKFSHVDFLIYNTLTKQPIKVIEVDGWHFHNNNETQKFRDNIKDQLLSKIGLCPIRISTTDTITPETIKLLLQ